jgi:hypothetical protein
MDTETLQRLRCIALVELGYNPFSDSTRMRPSEKTKLVDLIYSKFESMSADEIISEFNVLVHEKVFYNGADLEKYKVTA